MSNSFRTWRICLALALGVLIGWPLGVPVGELLATPSSWRAWSEWDRLLTLATNTLLLAGGTLAVTMTLGIPTAILLYRSDVPARRVLRAMVFLGLFIPLPLFATAWQATWGAAMILPWDQGLVPAIAVHSLAALPWVVWLTGLGLRRVDREWEEEALLAGGPIRCLWHVTLRRALPALGMAGLWVLVQTAGEITVTDLMLVRTFAEEVYTQFVLGDGLARSVAVALPGTLLVAGGVIWAVRRSHQSGVVVAVAGEPQTLLHLGCGRWPIALALASIGFVLIVVPIGNLLWRAGGGSIGSWSWHVFISQIDNGFTVHSGLLFGSLLGAAITGAITAALALLACWLTAESRFGRGMLMVLVIAAWTIPGPIVGFGLKGVIELVMNLEEAVLVPMGITGRLPLRLWLYDGPSPAPVMWAAVVRLFPFAVAILWPAVRAIPKDLIEVARVEGATPRQELRYVVWPLVRRTWFVAVLAVALLALGEVSAGKLVQTPGAATFTQELFNQMHYGVGPELAALALMQTAVTALVAGVLIRATHAAQRTLRS